MFVLLMYSVKEPYAAETILHDLVRKERSRPSEVKTKRSISQTLKQREMFKYKQESVISVENDKKGRPSLVYFQV